jgi:hypothetical protein
MSFKKKYVSIGIVLLVFCGVLAIVYTSKTPEIKKMITLSGITKEEYQKLNSENKPNGALINDFKKIYVNVKIINSIKSPERKISIPDLSFIINNYDKVRVVTGGDSQQNNVQKEDIAETTAFVIFDSRGMSDQYIRNLYNKSEIMVSYKLKNGEIIKNQFLIGANLEVNK